MEDADAYEQSKLPWVQRRNDAKSVKELSICKVCKPSDDVTGTLKGKGIGLTNRWSCRLKLRPDW
jgi:hypothetical protein